MKVVTPEISRHQREPIYSVDLQPLSGNFQRLASCGVNRIVRIWRIRVDGEGKADVDFLSNLCRHSATVNVCRFSPYGKLLATAGDDTTILLWKLSEVHTPASKTLSDKNTDKETWVVYKTLRGHLGAVYDLCWSSDGRYIVSGSADNSAIAWDTQRDVKLALFNEHKSYVQGVAWDPLREFIATLSSDRSCRIYSQSTKHCIHNVSKIVPPHVAASAPEGMAVRLYHDDTLRSYFRRLTFSPDGQLLITPAGLMETKKGLTNATFVFARGSFKEPAAYLPSANKASVAVRVCPCLFELKQLHGNNASEHMNDSVRERRKHATVFCLPYRVVFAVATEDSVVLYDSQQTLPLVYLSNIHYNTLSDLAWSKDGKILVVSSMDGCFSVITFDYGELGVPYTPTPSSSTSFTTEMRMSKHPQFSGDCMTTHKLPMSLNLKTAAVANEENMEVDTDSKASPSRRPSDSTTTDASSIKRLPCSPPQIKPSTSDSALASEIRNIGIFSSGSSAEGTKRSVKREGDQHAQDRAKFPKRQFNTSP